MTEEISLQYGGQSLTLEKSDRLIAVRPKPGMELSMGRAIDELSSVRRTSDTNLLLGGFQVIEVGGNAEEADAGLERLRLDPAVAAGSHVYHTSDDAVPFVPTGELYLEFKPQATSEMKEAVLDQYKLEIMEARSDNALIAKTTRESPNPVKVAAQLQKDELIDFAEPELATPGKLKNFVMPNDPLLNGQWHLRNTGCHRGQFLGFKTGADARVVAAWQVAETLGSQQVVLAVIDDGFDLDHPDFKGTGKVVHPWDFSRGNDAPSPDPNSQDWHGTACAGVALGNANGVGILGVAPAVTLMPIRWGADLGERQIEAWFAYARDSGAWVVSCSWGAAAANFPLGRRRQLAISDCAKNGRNGKGCVIVFAAGNSNHDVNSSDQKTLDGFAIHPDVITVSASNSRDQRSTYSNFGKEIWVCAPSSGAGGWGILTSDVTGSWDNNGVTRPRGYAAGDYTYDFGGTSSACPLVAGVCALVLSCNSDLTAGEVKDILRDTARPIGDDQDANGHSIFFGYGCVDAEAAVKAALSASSGRTEDLLAEAASQKHGSSAKNRSKVS